MEDMAQKQVTGDDAIQDMLPLLDQELSRLPDKYRVPIILCDLEGKTRKAAAKQLYLPEKTFSTWLARGRSYAGQKAGGCRGAALSSAPYGGAVVVSQNMTSASVPPSLVSSTVKIGALVVAGKTGAAGLISAKVAALTEGVVKTMLLTKLKTLAAVLIVVGMTTYGGGLFISRSAWTLAADEVKQGTPPAKITQKGPVILAVQEPKREEPKLRGTLNVDTLSMVMSLAFSPDGKTLASASYDQTIKLWDVATGKEKATFQDPGTGPRQEEFVIGGQCGPWRTVRTARRWPRDVGNTESDDQAVGRGGGQGKGSP